MRILINTDISIFFIFIGRKKANLWPIPLFHAGRPIGLHTGVIDPEKTPRRKRRPFVVQKWPFKAFFAQVRLADTELTATRSYRQIEALASVFGGRQKT